MPVPIACAKVRGILLGPECLGKPDFSTSTRPTHDNLEMDRLNSPGLTISPHRASEVQDQYHSCHGVFPKFESAHFVSDGVPERNFSVTEPSKETIYGTEGSSIIERSSTSTDEPCGIVQVVVHSSEIRAKELLKFQFPVFFYNSLCFYGVEPWVRTNGDLFFQDRPIGLKPTPSNLSKTSVDKLLAEMACVALVTLITYVPIDICDRNGCDEKGCLTWTDSSKSNYLIDVKYLCTAHLEEDRKAAFNELDYSVKTQLTIKEATEARGEKNRPPVEAKYNRHPTRYVLRLGKQFEESQRIAVFSMIAHVKSFPGRCDLGPFISGGMRLYPGSAVRDLLVTEGNAFQVFTPVYDFKDCHRIIDTMKRAYENYVENYREATVFNIRWTMTQHHLAARPTAEFEEMNIRYGDGAVIDPDSDRTDQHSTRSDQMSADEITMFNDLLNAGGKSAENESEAPGLTVRPMSTLMPQPLTEFKDKTRFRVPQFDYYDIIFKEGPHRYINLDFQTSAPVDGFISSLGLPLSFSSTQSALVCRPYPRMVHESAPQWIFVGGDPTLTTSHLLNDRHTEILLSFNISLSDAKASVRKRAQDQNEPMGYATFLWAAQPPINSVACLKLDKEDGGGFIYQSPSPITDGQISPFYTFMKDKCRICYLMECRCYAKQKPGEILEARHVSALPNKPLPSDLKYFGYEIPVEHFVEADFPCRSKSCRNRTSLFIYTYESVPTVFPVCLSCWRNSPTTQIFESLVQSSSFDYLENKIVKNPAFGLQSLDLLPKSVSTWGSIKLEVKLIKEVEVKMPHKISAERLTGIFPSNSNLLAFDLIEIFNRQEVSAVWANEMILNTNTGKQLLPYISYHPGAARVMFLGTAVKVVVGPEKQLEALADTLASWDYINFIKGKYNGPFHLPIFWPTTLLVVNGDYRFYFRASMPGNRKHMLFLSNNPRFGTPNLVFYDSRSIKNRDAISMRSDFALALYHVQYTRKPQPSLQSISFMTRQAVDFIKLRWIHNPLCWTIYTSISIDFEWRFIVR